MNQPAIQTFGLTKRFGDFATVESLDLRVESSEVFGFLGGDLRVVDALAALNDGVELVPGLVNRRLNLCEIDTIVTCHDDLRQAIRHEVDVDTGHAG